MRSNSSQDARRTIHTRIYSKRSYRASLIEHCMATIYQWSTPGGRVGREGVRSECIGGVVVLLWVLRGRERRISRGAHDCPQIGGVYQARDPTGQGRARQKTRGRNASRPTCIDAAGFIYWPMSGRMIYTARLKPNGVCNCPLDEVPLLARVKNRVYKPSPTREKKPKIRPFRSRRSTRARMQHWLICILFA